MPWGPLYERKIFHLTYAARAQNAFSVYFQKDLKLNWSERLRVSEILWVSFCEKKNTSNKKESAKFHSGQRWYFKSPSRSVHRLLRCLVTSRNREMVFTFNGFLDIYIDGISRNILHLSDRNLYSWSRVFLCGNFMKIYFINRWKKSAVFFLLQLRRISWSLTPWEPIFPQTIFLSR